LLGFTPSPKPTSLELEALAGALELTSKKAPERFDVDLTCFTQLRPMFARSLIRGLTEAAVENRAVPLQRLFILYSAIASWTATAVKPEQLWEDNLDGLQLEVARSLRKLLSHDPPILKLEWRDSVWEIARSLTTARNPTVDYERRYSNGRKFATLSLNTTRGEAMHTLFSYATWVRRLTEGVQQQQNPAPEILEVLDRRLDPAIEPTMTIRAVYGEKLGWLFHFHEEWVRANLSRIFPKDSELAELKRVAWDTFVTFSNPSITLYDLLKTEYQDAVAKVGDDNSSDDQHDLGPPEEALSHHLLALYWWGALSIEGPTSLLAKFFQLAPVKLRAHAIDYVGRALKNTKTVPPYIIAHLQKLFDWRLGIAGQSADNSKHEAELAAFGSWVWSGKFDATWLLSRLQEVLMKIRELTRYGMYILEELSELSEKYPLETVRCLELIVTKEPQHLGWHAKPETVRNILKTAQESSSTAAREIASRTEDQLLRRGAFEYMTVESAAK